MQPLLCFFFSSVRSGLAARFECPNLHPGLASLPSAPPHSSSFRPWESRPIAGGAAREVEAEAAGALGCREPLGTASSSTKGPDPTARSTTSPSRSTARKVRNASPSLQASSDGRRRNLWEDTDDDSDEEAHITEISMPVGMWDFEHCDPKRWCVSLSLCPRFLRPADAGVPTAGPACSSSDPVQERSWRDST
jgi:hypothetical protein